MAEKIDVAFLVAVFRNGECKGCTFNDQAAAALELLAAEVLVWRETHEQFATTPATEDNFGELVAASKRTRRARNATDARLILPNERKEIAP